jgi:polyphosphate kinase 2 (PPK2 family)
VSYAIRIDDSKKIKLSDYDPDDTGKAKKGDSGDELLSLGGELGDLQELLYAAQKNAVLIVLQGMDTSGKDGTIAHVMAQVNPQGCAVASFKVPTPEEAAHDFLWRIHRQAPARGMLTIFNRSHYEDVLVTRVHGLIDKAECKRRYEQIRQFESLLADSGTLILKFFLHISNDEK